MRSPESSERIDAVLDALADRQRRFLLYYVRQRGEVDVDDLATALTGWQALRGAEGAAAPGDHRRIRATLHHRDLPKLADVGVLKVDRGEGTVTYRGTSTVDEVLDLLFDHESLPEEATWEDAGDREA